MNLKKILLVLIVVALIGVAAYFLLGQFEQTKPIQENINALGANAQNYVSENIPMLVGAGGVITTIGGAALNSVNNAKKKLNDTQVAASTQINSVLKQKDDVAAKFESAKTELSGANSKLTDVQKEFTDYRAEVEPQLAEVTTLQNKLSGMEEMHNNFVAQLTSGSQQVIDPATNQVYKLITLEKTVVK